MKRNTQLAELKTQVKRNTLHKVAARGGLATKMVVNRTKKSLRITWVKTTHCRGPFSDIGTLTAAEENCLGS